MQFLFFFNFLSSNLIFRIVAQMSQLREINSMTFDFSISFNSLLSINYLSNSTIVFNIVRSKLLSIANNLIKSSFFSIFCNQICFYAIMRYCHFYKTLIRKNLIRSFFSILHCWSIFDWHVRKIQETQHWNSRQYLNSQIWHSDNKKLSNIFLKIERIEIVLKRLKQLKLVFDNFVAKIIQKHFQLKINLIEKSHSAHIFFDDEISILNSINWDYNIYKNKLISTIKNKHFEM